MTRRVCSVCALPSDVRDYGEQLIVKGREYREVVALAPNGPSKSSWHRHMKSCFRRRAFYGIGKHVDKEERLITCWPDGSLWLGGERFDGKFRENDVLLKIIYTEVEIRKLGNAGALVTRDLIDEARAEYLQNFPDAKIAEGEAPALEEVSQDFGNNIPEVSDAPPW
jgi:hypothetical protein